MSAILHMSGVEKKKKDGGKGLSERPTSQSTVLGRNQTLR